MTTRIETRKAATRPNIGFYALIAPLALAAIGAYALSPADAFLSQNVALLWAGAAILFLAGRHSAGVAAGAAAAVIVYVIGFLQLFAIVWGFPLLASLLALAGLVCLAVTGRLGPEPYDDGGAVAAGPLMLAAAALVAVALLAGGYA